MGDGAPKTEQSSGQGIEMNGIDVARYGGVTAPDIARDVPCSRGTRHFSGSWRFSLARSRGRVGVGAAAMEVGAGFGPDRLVVNRGLAEHVELPSARMLA